MSFACEAVSAEECQINEAVCVICCRETAETLVASRTKGLQSLLHASETRGCESLSLYLRSGPPEVLIHNCCRKRFTDLRHVYDVASEHLSPKKLRSTKSVFDWKSACFLCSLCQAVLNEMKLFIKSKHYKFSLHLVIIVIFATMCGVGYGGWLHVSSWTVSSWTATLTLTLTLTQSRI